MYEQEKYDWMVYVSCMTFNQASYIVDTMNGFTMQETNFPFVCAIVDDASTDGEQEVIKSYLDEHFDLEDKKITLHEETDDYVLTFARHKTNLNCYFSVFYLKYNHYGKKSKIPYLVPWRDNAKYIAICEGDDYWIHPLKLSKQVSYLENHPNCGLSTSLCTHFIQEKRTLVEGKGKVHLDFRSILMNGGIGCATCTMLFRKECLNGYSELVTGQKWLMSDFPWILYVSHHSDIYCFDEFFSTYRILPESASHSRSYDRSKRFIESVFNIQFFFAKLYEPDIIETIEQNNTRKLFFNAIEFSQSGDVKKYFTGIKKPTCSDYIQFYKYYIKHFLKNA